MRLCTSFSALTLLVGWQEGHSVCKKLEWWDASVVICLERGAGWYIALMRLPLTVSSFSKIQIGFTFLVPARPGSPGQRAVKPVCMCDCAAVDYPWTKLVGNLKTYLYLPHGFPHYIYSPAPTKLLGNDCISSRLVAVLCYSFVYLD